MDYSLQQRTELIIVECMKISGTSPYEIFHTIAQKDYVRIHGPEHHVLDGACILTAFHNAGGNIDICTALQKLMCEGLKMPDLPKPAARGAASVTLFHLWNRQSNISKNVMV